MPGAGVRGTVLADEVHNGGEHLAPDASTIDVWASDLWREGGGDAAARKRFRGAITGLAAAPDVTALAGHGAVANRGLARSSSAQGWARQRYGFVRSRPVADALPRREPPSVGRERNSLHEEQGVRPFAVSG